MNVNAKPVIIETQGRRILYICPKCRQTIMFRKKYQGRSLCMRCGQRLDWSPENDIFCESIYAEDSDEAAWIAKEYYKINDMKEEDWIDITDFRNSLRGQGAELFLIFFSKRNHGRFMRSYAKEGGVPDG